MERAILQRFFQNDLVTYGTMTLPWTFEDDDGVECYTLELPWRGNENSISCVPAGVYPLRPVYSTKFGNILHVMDVPGRSLIRVHAGNNTSHTHGCILTGKSIGKVQGRDFIFNSRVALRAVVNAVSALYVSNTDVIKCELEIRDAGTDS